jgi:glycosyltransferase involved in cell wall biosynthesis
LKKVLIITYYWPPTSGSGVQRWLKFAKYLPEFAIKPIIFTPENPSYPLRDQSLISEIHEDTIVHKLPIKEAYGLISHGQGKGNNPVQSAQNDSYLSKFKSWIRGNVFIPDPKISWVKPAVKYLDKLLQEDQINTVITTGPPHSMHLIGLELKKKHKIKWIADFRDPWSQFGDLMDKYYVTSGNRKKYEQLEQAVVNSCDIVLTTSKYMHERLMPFDLDKMQVITNGFDESDFDSFTNNSLLAGLKIYSAGMLYAERDAPSLWEALDTLSTKYDSLQLHLVGVDSGNVVPSIRKMPRLSKRFTFEGFKPHPDVIADYQEANILLLLVNNSENAKACIPGKTFEYIATGKPIICLAPEGAEVADALYEGNNLILSYSNSAKENIKLLSAFFDRVNTNDIIQSDAAKFTRRNLTKALANLID